MILQAASLRSLVLLQYRADAVLVITVLAPGSRCPVSLISSKVQFTTGASETCALRSGHGKARSLCRFFQLLTGHDHNGKAVADWAGGGGGGGRGESRSKWNYEVPHVPYVLQWWELGVINLVEDRDGHVLLANS